VSPWTSWTFRTTPSATCNTPTRSRPVRHREDRHPRRKARDRKAKIQAGQRSRATTRLAQRHRATGLADCVRNFQGYQRLIFLTRRRRHDVALADWKTHQTDSVCPWHRWSLFATGVVHRAMLLLALNKAPAWYRRWSCHRRAPSLSSETLAAKSGQPRQRPLPAAPSVQYGSALPLPSPANPEHAPSPARPQMQIPANIRA
jgi:hypothetical protein